MGNYQVIGKKFPRIDSPIKVTGGARYVEDMALPGMLIGKILRSPYPHARILHLDSSRAERILGVRKVMTPRNIPMIRYGTFQDFLPQCCDETPLAVDKVRYVGDPVAAVAAVDEDAGLEALDLIHIDYEELVPVFDGEEAIKEGAPIIHEGVERNIIHHVRHNYGDVEKGFLKADLVREDKFVTYHVNHAFLETLACLVEYDLDKGLMMWASTQVPFLLRGALAKIMGLPLNKVRIIQPFVGGGFGGKSDVPRLFTCTALLAKLTGRPIKIKNSREEQFLEGRHRHAVTIQIKTGVKRDGKIMAKEGFYLADGGAYASHGPIVIANAVGFFSILHRIPHVRFIGLRVYTNKPPCGAMRGFGVPQLMFADGSHLDMVSQDLAMDPVEFHLKNLSQRGDLTPSKYFISSSSLRDCINTAVRISSWKEAKEKMSFFKGLGLALGSHTAGAKMGPNDATSALVKVHEDGTVSLFIGISEHGQGSKNMTALILAEELGIPLEAIRVDHTDTEICPMDIGAFGSRTTIPAGRATIRAAKEVKDLLFRPLADHLECSSEDLMAQGGRIFIKGSPERGITFQEAISLYYQGKESLPLVGRGLYDPEGVLPLDLSTGENNFAAAYGFGAQVVELEINKETGKVKVNRIYAVNDPGKVLDLLNLEGQSEGSVIMGLGQALFEKIEMDGKGCLLNPSFLHYYIPTSMETPEIISLWIESIDPQGPYGAKGVTEVTLNPTPAAIANAIQQALGLRIKELPITPEKIIEGRP